MKEKIFLALKKSILIGGKTSVSDETINMYVDLIDCEKITDETQIAEAIKPYVSVLKATQANINSVAANAAKTKESELKAEFEKNSKQADQTAPPVNEQPKEDEMPSWAKAILGKVENLETGLGALNGEKLTNSRKSRLEQVLEGTGKFKDLTLKNFGRMKFETEEEFEEFFTGLEAESKELKQQIENAAVSTITKPIGGNNKGQKQLTDDEIKAMANNINV